MLFDSYVYCIINNIHVWCYAIFLGEGGALYGECIYIFWRGCGVINVSHNLWNMMLEEGSDAALLTMTLEMERLLGVYTKILEQEIQWLEMYHPTI